MQNTQKIFLQLAPGDINIYGIHDLFFKKVKEKFLSKNLTWNKIGRIFGLHGKNPEKNIWEWRKGKTGIPLRAVRIMMSSENSLLNLLSKSTLVFGERRSKHKIKLPKLNKDLAYLAGLISGDGNIQLYFTRIVDEFKENLECVDAMLKDQFKLPTIIRKEKDNKWLLEINSRIISEFFDKVLGVPIGTKEKIDVPSLINKSKREIKIAYIRGWMDAEASVEQWFKTKEKWYLRICFKVKNKEIWEWITNELESLGIRISKFVDKENSYRFQILRKNSIRLYLNYIGFLYPTKLNKIYKLVNLQTETLLSQ